MRQNFAALLLMAGMVIGVPLAKADPTPSIIFHLKSGTKIVLPIDDKPVITFDNGMITIGNDRYSISNVSKYTISSTEAGIANIMADGITIDDENIIIRNVSDVDALHIYTTGGMECPCSKIVDNNCIIINISELTSGYYILSAGLENIKFGKK